MIFQLDATLARDTVEVTRFTLCRVLIMNDARYRWVILVPARPGLVEIHDLTPQDRQVLMAEMMQISTSLDELYKPDKINIGALGNIVSQLHIHIIARFKGDPAWPGPVWGHGDAVPYAPDALEKIRSDLLSAFA